VAPALSFENLRSLFADSFRALAGQQRHRGGDDPDPRGVPGLRPAMPFPASAFPVPAGRADAFLVSQMFSVHADARPLYIIIVHFLGLGSTFPAWFALHGDGHSLLRLVMKGYFDTIPRSRRIGADRRRVVRRRSLPHVLRSPNPRWLVTALSLS